MSLPRRGPGQCRTCCGRGAARAVPGAQRGGSTRWQHGRTDGREAAGNGNGDRDREGEREGTRQGARERAARRGMLAPQLPASSQLGCEAVDVFPSFDSFGIVCLRLLNAFFHFSAQLCVVFIDEVLYFLCSHMDLMLTFLQFFILLGFVLFCSVFRKTPGSEFCH